MYLKKKKKVSNAEHVHFLFMPAEENERTVIVKQSNIQGFWTRSGHSDFVASFISLEKKKEQSFASVNYSV